MVDTDIKSLPYNLGIPARRAGSFGFGQGWLSPLERFGMTRAE